MKKQHTCILVLGMHRSGTSALARVVSLLGAALPERLMGAWHGNETGHWEPEQLVALNDEMLRSVGSSWDDLRSIDAAAIALFQQRGYQEKIAREIETDFSGQQFFVIKDPRICRFVPIYVDALETLNIRPLTIIPLRNPLAVARSLNARREIPMETIGYGMLLWLRHFLDAEKSTRGRPRVFVDHSDLLSDWRGTMTRIARNLEITWPVSADAASADVETFLDPRLSHHGVTIADLETNPETHPDVVQAYRLGMTLQDTPSHPATLEALDRLSANFNDTFSFTQETTYKEFRLRENNLLTESHGLKSTLAETSQRLDNAGSNLEALGHAFKELQDANEAERVIRAEAEAKRASAETALSETSQRLDDANSNLKSLGHAFKELQDANEAERATRAEAEAKAASLRQAIVDEQAKRASAELATKIFRERIAEVQASSSWRLTKPLRSIRRLLSGLDRADPDLTHQPEAPSSTAHVTSSKPAVASASYLDIIRTSARISGGWRNLPFRALQVFRTGGISAVRHRVRFAREKAQACQTDGNP